MSNNLIFTTYPHRNEIEYGVMAEVNDGFYVAKLIVPPPQNMQNQRRTAQLKRPCYRI